MAPGMSDGASLALSRRFLQPLRKIKRDGEQSQDKAEFISSLLS
jgi:hypothetical protein